MNIQYITVSKCSTKFILALACLLMILLWPTSLLAADTAIDPSAARDQLLNGVTTMADPSGPGRMVVWGDNAYAVANYKDATALDPMMAVAGWGQGRIIAMPDHQWLNMNSYGDTGDTGLFYRNGLAWLTDTTSKDIKIIVARSSAKTWLEGQGYTDVTESNSYASLLGDADVLVGWLGSNVSQADLDTISAFVQNGGGLFLAEYGIGYDWWWGKAIPDAPGNKLLSDVGIGFTNSWPRGGGDIDPKNRVDIQVTAADVLAMLADSTGFTNSELENGAAVLSGMFNVLPEGDPLLAQLDTNFWARISQINPTPGTPVSDKFEQALLSREATLLGNTPVEDVTAHRTVEAIYGAVPAGAPRVNQSVTLDMSNSRWLPTGLYAAPGEVVTINVPSSLVGKGYLARVNAHKSDIYPRSSWERPPEAHRWFSIDSTEVKVANAFGGLIFIDVGGTPPNLGNVDITLQNAVEAPYFVLGQHTDQQWNDTQSKHPAPYALLVGEKLIIAMPTHDVTSLEKPTALMEWWDQVVTLEDDLGDQTQFRTSPELMNVDVQIGYGAAHAGYPYQAYDKHWGNPADLDRLLSSGSWGDFHELGHNHQRGWWTFPGDGEVTVNIFSNYALETMNPNATGGWAWSADPVEVMKRSITTVQEGGTYANKSNRWAYWFQLADGFGWDTYRNIFHGYEEDNANNKSALPTNTQEEKDQWLVRFSLEVGYDMTKYMRDTWGLQVTQSAVDQVSHLPSWMPVIGAAEDVYLPAGLTHTFDFAGDALALDGVATVTGVTSPADGMLKDNGDGTYTYTRNSSFDGKDSFTYMLKSSGENVETFTVNITGEITNAPSFYFSSSTGGRVGGIRFADEDILAFDPDTEQWSMHFDGSDMGLRRGDINAFHILDDGNILLSLNRARTVGGALYDDSDIIEFTATSLGSTTTGSFSLYLDGSDVQLTTNGEDIDAISLLSNGDLIISTLGTAKVTGVTAKDEDLLRFHPSQLGLDTQGTWSLYLDGSDLGMTHRYEDIWAAWVDDSVDQVYLSTLKNYDVSSSGSSLTGDGDDIVLCDGGPFGDNTQCALSHAWDGDAHGFGAELVDGYSVGPMPAATIFSAAAEAEGESFEVDDVREDDVLDDDEYTEHLYLPLIK